MLAIACECECEIVTAKEIQKVTVYDETRNENNKLFRRYPWMSKSFLDQIILIKIEGYQVNRICHSVSVDSLQITTSVSWSL